ncbi:hypothetical protein NBRC116493_30280 [Aurantivibrio infirmus]
MERVFQHYEGEIEELIGVQISNFKYLTNLDDSDIVLLWFLDAESKSWYRLFVDGAYCGLDKYETDNSGEDIDDGVVLVDDSHWFKDKIIKQASVAHTKEPDRYIVLKLNFGASFLELVCASEDGECSLKYVPSKNA